VPCIGATQKIKAIKKTPKECKRALCYKGYTPLAFPLYLVGLFCLIDTPNIVYTKKLYLFFFLDYTEKLWYPIGLSKKPLIFYIKNPMAPYGP
jgi:hypothetical protein